MSSSIRTIAREHPASIRETARLLNRDVNQVHDTVTELAQLNLLRLKEGGRRKRPVVRYEHLGIEAGRSSVAVRPVTTH